jgi:hypothetical protein
VFLTRKKLFSSKNKQKKIFVQKILQKIFSKFFGAVEKKIFFRNFLPKMGFEGFYDV